MTNPQAELFTYSRSADGTEIPRAPAARTEQRSLAIGKSISARYARWRVRNSDVFLEIERRALKEAQGRSARIEINRIVAELRSERRIEMDNSFRAPIARELLDRNPTLKGLIEIRRAPTSA